MASGHLGQQGQAPGVTQPGGTPSSTTGEIPLAPEGERDVIGEAGEPHRHREQSDLADEVPVDADARRAAATSPGQRLSAGEG